MHSLDLYICTSIAVVYYAVPNLQQSNSAFTKTIFFFWLQLHRGVCKPVNNTPPVQSQAIPPLLEKQEPRNSPAPLARSWSSSTAVARGWAGNFPTDCISISECRCVKRQAYQGSAMISAALCQSPDSSPAHLPRLGGRPAPGATVCLLSGMLLILPSPAPLFPLGRPRCEESTKPWS